MNIETRRTSCADKNLLFSLNIRNTTAVMGAFARNKYCADYHNNALLAGAFANPDNPLSLMPPNRTHLTLQPF